MKNIFSRIALPLFVASAYVFLYIPIAILIIFSFNSAVFPYKWSSFSWQWYEELIKSPVILQAARNSFIVAGVASLLSLLLGALIVFYGSHYKLRGINSLFYANLMIPEIVLAIGLLSLFTFFSVPLGLITLIAGHTILGLGYAVPILSNTFSQIDKSIVEASLDLGASYNQTFVSVVMPLLMPAFFAAGLLVFIISLDDFLISFFCAGGSAQTLSLYIFAMIRTGVTPSINALSTVLLVISSIVILIFNALKLRIY